ncbi:50S ribosomal protein L10 [candidate division WS6 bacterium RIFOXYC1_FULL_33_10]|uniref:Large ribosomal subunit protein uL10 n=2 Tax=Candidatus Dojkabacteria TaxID=74243 RepID=A0A1F4UHL6_9BACT|nr:MAG: 50S ribosomal protein L10 [candidate division WS6 bacterium RIFOXYB1_FULL_33_14]OGC45059.1 MAG: 50S ribosomal protein L10 [candidate division WS6 bacterium RIFOXYC1_FULL_33_10]
MSKSRTQKEELLKKYKDLIESKSGYLLVNSDKIDTATVTKLKIELKDVGGNFTVLKNSIFKVALQDTKQPLQTQDFDGPTALIAFEQDPTAPAKLVKKVQKESELLEPRAGVYEGEFLTAERVMQLADIPSKEVLLSRLVGTMNAPLTGFMNAITGNVRGLTMVLKGISEKK